MNKKVVKRLALIAAVLAALLSSCSDPRARTGLVDSSSQQAQSSHLIASTWVSLSATEAAETQLAERVLLSDANSWAESLAALIKTGNQLIWSVGQEASDAVLSAATAQPAIQFVVVDSTTEHNLDNLTTITFKEYEGSFLAGFLAARFSQSGKVAFFAQRSQPLSERNDASFKAGVALANSRFASHVSVYSRYLDQNSDTASVRQAGLEAIQVSSDVLYCFSDALDAGLQQAAAEGATWLISRAYNPANPAPAQLLAAIVKQARPIVTLLSQNFAAGEFKGGQQLEIGLADAAIAILTPGLDQSTESAAKLLGELDLVHRQLSQAAWQLPTNPAQLFNFMADLPQSGEL